MDCVSAITDYFQKNVKKLKSNNNYWSIPHIEGFEHSKGKSYSANVELKKYLNNKWHKSSAEQKIALSKTIVYDWGRIRGHKDETLKKYVSEIESENPATPLKGVASYSKIYSVVNLEEYAIYDARVAVSLNSIQYSASVENGLAFNYLDGRNNITGNCTTKRGFRYAEPFRIDNLIQSGWQKIEKDRTYKVYLELLQSCLKTLPEYTLYDLEMALFSNAEKNCLKAANKAGIIL